MNSYSLQMDINITKLSDKEIAGICIKYNIIQSNELKNYTRDRVINEIQNWCCIGGCWYNLDI